MASTKNVLEAIDIVCGECLKGGYERCNGMDDACCGCPVVEIAQRMRWEIEKEW